MDRAEMTLGEAEAFEAGKAEGQAERDRLRALVMRAQFSVPASDRNWHADARAALNGEEPPHAE